MAIFHLNTKAISRKNGRTATASIAYRTAEKIYCERTGETHDYTKKSGVMHTNIIAFDNEKIIKIDRQKLWNLAEKTEKRKDARVAREIIINLPFELSHEQRIKLIDEFSTSLAKKYSIAIDYAIHEPNRNGDDRNYHAHLLLTTRKIEIDKNKNIALSEKSNLELENKKLKSLGLKSTQEQITEIRKTWAETTNKHLKNAGYDIEISHLSNKDRNIDIEPTKKMGVARTSMERQGIETEVGNHNRRINDRKNTRNQIHFDSENLNIIDNFLKQVKINEQERIRQIQEEERLRQLREERLREMSRPSELEKLLRQREEEQRQEEQRQLRLRQQQEEEKKRQEEQLRLRQLQEEERQREEQRLRELQQQEEERKRQAELLRQQQINANEKTATSKKTTSNDYDFSPF